MKHHIHFATRTTMSFFLVVVIAGLLSIFLKPSITGAIVLNDNVGSPAAIAGYLLMAVAFLSVYALYHHHFHKPH